MEYFDISYKLQMKKIVSIVTILIALLIPITSMAANIEVNLTSNSQEYTISEENDTFTVNVELGEFVSLESGNALAYSAIIDYDTSILEVVEVKGLNDWSATYNSNNNKIVCDTIKATENTDVTQITFKAKKDAIKNNKATTIKLKNVEISDGEFEINTQKEIQINLISSEKTGEGLPQKVSDIKIIAGEKAIETTTSQNESGIVLPNAGISQIIIITIVVLIILIIIFKIKSRKIKY